MPKEPKRVWTLIDMYGQITVYTTEKKAVTEAISSGYAERDGNDFYRSREDLVDDEEDKIRLGWAWLK